MITYQRVGVGVGISLLSVTALVGCATSPGSSNQPANHTTQSAVRNTTQANTTAPSPSTANSTANGTPPTSTTAPTTPPSTPSSTDIQFNGTIANAMQYAQKHGTKVPLMAPTEPEFSPLAPYIGATASASSGAYSVNLFSTNQQLPLNSSAFSTAKYQQAMNIIGSFGAVSYSSPTVAKQNLYQSAKESIAPAYVEPPTSTASVSSAKVDLGHGIVGAVYTSSSTTPAVYTPMVLWHEGDWTLEVWDAPATNEDIKESKSIVAYLNTHLLPETYGVFGENIAGDGNHTTVEWAYGNTVYSTFSYGSGLMAAKMAVSMRTYPTGSIRP